MNWHSRFIKQAERCARSLIEQQQEAPSAKLLSVQEVVMEVVPKVLQGFWLPSTSTSFNMPPQQLRMVAAVVTKAVDNRESSALSTVPHWVALCHSIRDVMALSIQKRLESHTLKTNSWRGLIVSQKRCITDAAVREICLLFQTPTNLPWNMDCMAISSPSAPPITTADPPANTKVLDSNLDEAEEQLTCSPEPDFVANSAPPAHLNPLGEPPVISAKLEDPSISQDEPSVKVQGRKKRFSNWFKKTFYFCFLLKVKE